MILVEAIGGYSRRSDLLQRLEKVRKRVQMVQSEQRDNVTYTPYRLEQRLDPEVREQLARDYEAGIPTTQLTQTYRLSKPSVLMLLQVSLAMSKGPGSCHDLGTASVEL